MLSFFYRYAMHCLHAYAYIAYAFFSNFPQELAHTNSKLFIAFAFKKYFISKCCQINFLSSNSFEMFNKRDAVS